MKKFNKKVFVIYVYLIVFLLIGKIIIEPNYWNIYMNIYQPFGLFILSILCYILNREGKDYLKKKKALLETILIIMMFYGIIYFLSGLLFTFTNSPYSHELVGILKNLWTYIIVIIPREYIRYTLIRYSGDKPKYFIIILVLFFILELNFASLANNFQTNEAIFKYFVSILVPCVCHNLVANYLVLRGNYKVSIVYLGVLKLLTILLPVYPNLDWFFVTLYELLLGFVIYIFTSDFYEKKILRLRGKRLSNSNILSYVPWIILLIVLVLFVAGFFKYKPVAIISNSMYPEIKRGDAVISRKLAYDELKNIRLNDVIEYKLGGSSIIHRVVAIDLDNKGNLVFVTKGDNNNDVDNEVVTMEQVVGIVNFKIPFIGYPSVWLTEFLVDGTTPDVELGN